MEKTLLSRLLRFPLKPSGKEGESKDRYGLQGSRREQGAGDVGWREQKDRRLRGTGDKREQREAEGNRSQRAWGRHFLMTFTAANLPWVHWMRRS